ncbi:MULTISPECIES: restriction endonuclease subunit S [Collinsella]|uniref:restriction endonuclease subunit S n=1 Tax=Collinsella TaxID=102106 RepID=UPI000B39CF6E|nr:MULTISPECIES: restriction endonuclease subunit S [Collinsella]MBM6908648.1 restriction endonuclease subunit S [Collinsella intestinalis]OUO64775.1 restriction endonuclease [Collinsella sp. An268]
MRTKLGDVCASIYDGDHNAPPKSGSGIPFITISNIDANDGFIDFSDTAFVPEEYYKSLKGERKPKRGDVLYSVVGSFGIPSLLKDDKRFVFQRHIAILRPSEKLDSTYLYYLLKDSSFYHWADAVAIGSAQRTVTLGQLRSKEVNLPDLETQRRIAGVLSAYDGLIENNRKQIKLLEEAARRLYKDWFVDLHFPGYEATSIVNGLPKGWRKGSLLSWVNNVRGRSYGTDDLKKAGESKLINLNNVAAFGGWNAGAEKPYSGTYRREQVVAGGDIIMAVTDMTKERRLVGHVARVPKDAAGNIISMDLIKIVPQAVEPNYLYAYLRFSGIAEMIAMLANGTNIIHLKPESLIRAELLVPSRRIQLAYGSNVQAMFDAIEVAERQISAAREARNRLLPKLMSGEIEV